MFLYKRNNILNQIKTLKTRWQSFVKIGPQNIDFYSKLVFNISKMCFFSHKKECFPSHTASDNCKEHIDCDQ